jgi:hypothetical protein
MFHEKKRSKFSRGSPFKRASISNQIVLEDRKKTRIALIILFTRLVKSDSRYEIFLASFAKILLLKQSFAFRENYKKGFSLQP